MHEDAGEEAAGPAFLRFVPQADRQRALDAFGYATAMIGQSRDLATIGAWCYELAANGVPYPDWPELVILRHLHAESAGGDSGDSLQRARTASEAMGLVDFGEI